MYYFGARYYDPRTSIWQSVDPILGKYLPSANEMYAAKREGKTYSPEKQLAGMGGVYNALNLGLYTYTHQNPVILLDPNGMEPYSQDFWDAYLNYDIYGASDVWDTISGNVGKTYGPDSNSCSARVCYGLNYGGEPIPANVPGGNRNYNGDNKRYILSARQLKKYAQSNWGEPTKLESVADLNALIEGLQDNQVAVILSEGHAAVVKKGYSDSYVESYLGDAYVLPVKPQDAPKPEESE